MSFQACTLHTSLTGEKCRPQHPFWTPIDKDATIYSKMSFLFSAVGFCCNCATCGGLLQETHKSNTKSRFSSSSDPSLIHLHLRNQDCCIPQGKTSFLVKLVGALILAKKETEVNPVNLHSEKVTPLPETAPLCPVETRFHFQHYITKCKENTLALYLLTPIQSKCLSRMVCLQKWGYKSNILFILTPQFAGWSKALEALCPREAGC